MKDTLCCRAADIDTTDLKKLPDALVSARHLIYSSPATLAFNSPGAEGFGVKRAGLAIPGSVMLIVSPGCCGRNTSLISRLRGYDNRFFYLTLDDTDIVTGRHLKRVPQAVAEIYGHLCEMGKAPSVVMICITCVDALLGTDMDRVCKKAMEKVPVPVLPCYMYALTREGRKPPMVHVRQSIYSLLKPMKKKPAAVNLLGYFSPLHDTSELYSYLKGAGVKTIREISRMQDYESYLMMAEANFNLVLHPEARYAANDLAERLSIPYVELKRFYDIRRIRKQYQAFARVLGTEFSDEEDYKAAKEAVEDFKKAFGPVSFSIGECMNGDPFELSLALTGYGFSVSEIFGTITSENLPYLRLLQAVSPDTLVYSNMEPSMMNYNVSDKISQVTIGKDAVYYHPEAVHLMWNEEIQPFGYDGVRLLFEALTRAMKGEKA